MNDPALVGTVPPSTVAWLFPFFNCLSTSKDGRPRLEEEGGQCENAFLLYTVTQHYVFFFSVYQRDKKKRSKNKTSLDL
jgi:hypothetical protein